MVTRYVATLEAVSGLPEDRIVNTYYFDHLGNPTETQAANTADAIADCYQIAVGAQGNALNTYLSPWIARGAAVHSVRVYNDEVAGSPLYIFPFGLDDPGGAPNALPDEVALCLSYHGDLTGVPEERPDGIDPGAAVDRPAARRRFRLYYGPFNVNALHGIQQGRPSANLVSALQGIGKHLIDTIWQDGTGDTIWVGKSVADDSYRTIIGGHIDNAWDTQRRRGRSAFSRTLFPV